MILAERLCIVLKTLRQEEKQGASVLVKLKHHLVIEFHLVKGIGDSFRVIAIVV